MKKYLIGVFIGVLLVTPVIALMFFAHEIIGHFHLPVELIHSTFGLVVMDSVLFAEYAVIMVPYFLWGLIISMIAYVRLNRDNNTVRFRRGILIGLFFGFPLFMIVAALLETWYQRVVGLLLLSSLFIGWGFAYIYTYNQIILATKRKVEQQISPTNRRQFLWRVGAMATLVTLASGWFSTLWHGSRRERLSSKMQRHDSFPLTLTAKVYPTNPKIQFPEQQLSRYQPSQHPIGVCFSSGGPRAACSALGQMRGLHALGLLDKIGAISGVSGGGWFSTLFTYAPTTIDEDTLLGTVVEPEKIIVKDLGELNPLMLTAPFSSMTDHKMLHVAREVIRSISFSETAAFNRFYSRILNEMLLKPFQLDNHHRFFTLDNQAVSDILKRNPTLKPNHFYTARPNRPYLICGSTQIYPLGDDQILRAFEFTSLYSGMPKLYPSAGNNGADLGGGYIENLAFDSLAPLEVQSNGLVTVPTPEPIFLLSDMIGSTSAGPGIMLDHYQEPDLMAEFNLWPLKNHSNQSTFNYSIVDGASLEHNGIVPLLYRQYPIILVFVNTMTPLGTQAPDTINGISIQVSRLFGFEPEQMFFNQPNIQIFPREHFEPLANGLKSAKENGKAAIYIDSYSIVQPNVFGIPSYPNDGKVTVVWCYHDLNQGWLDKLSPEVQTLLNSDDPTNRLDNFPYFRTAAQNHTDDGIPQMLYYSPQQINLLANMWCYNIMHDARDILLSLNQS
jgi:hypothetical protein